MTEKKYFTPLEAAKTLPLVKNIVKDILIEGNKLKEIAVSLKEESTENDHFKSSANKLESFLIELAEIGCIYKDWNFNVGLVDFPSVIDGKDVYLCWSGNEDKISFYHDTDAGLVGRKLIPEEYLQL